MPEKTTTRGQLTAKQRRFISGYLANGFNGTKAAIDAGYSKSSAYSIASENLKKPEIAAEIEASVLAQTTPEACKMLLCRLAASNMADFEPWLMGKKTLRQLREEGVDTSLVKRARLTNKGGRSLELYDKLGAVRELDRVLGLPSKTEPVAFELEDLSDMSNGELLSIVAAGDLVGQGGLKLLPDDCLDELATEAKAETARRKRG